jgi:hypothetical protein
MRSRQGNSTPILITFDESIGDNELLVTVHDIYDKVVWKASTGNGIVSLGNNVYRAEIPHSVTKNFTGRYYLDMLLKSPGDTTYVNVADKPVEMVFKKAVIIKEIEQE